MPIILAHPSFPWQEEALAVAQHKPNVFIDLSGWSPKYFPPILVQYANTHAKDKMLFGSDWPVITPDRWLNDFEKIDDPGRRAPAHPERKRGEAVSACEPQGNEGGEDMNRLLKATALAASLAVAASLANAKRAARRARRSAGPPGALHV